MRHSGGLDSKGTEAHDAAWEAGRGALIGAAKWGAATALLGAVGYAVSPIYRNLTFQFKVYLQMSGMIMGGALESDHRLRAFERKVRIERRMAIDRATWQRFEEGYEEPRGSSTGTTAEAGRNADVKT